MQRLQRPERIARGQVLAEIDLADAEQSRERRADRLARDRGANLADLRVGLPLFRGGAIELGLRDDAIAQQTLHALIVQAGEIALRFDRGQLRALLPRVELGEDVAAAHRASRIERELVDDAGKVGADGDALHGGHGAYGAERRRPFVLTGDNGGHGFRRRLEGRALGHRGLNLLELEEAERSDDDDHHHEHHNHSFEHASSCTWPPFAVSITSEVMSELPGWPLLAKHSPRNSNSSSVDRNRSSRAESTSSMRPAK